ncbi:MAG TPA: SDR family NAD(P)-dependent oxidoreductase [Acidimicrobiales bacterium]|jgi:NAD(P)-dependent dehydrogenase (short-subunit alcohol dehydrogenase family)|nr:SDR family NAD(P)-dependent oxidoreductase [Acidimicrobiales bacterium]
MVNLSQSVALVTGGARGIGRAICAKLVEYGAAVAVTDSDSDGAKQTAAELTAAGGASQDFRYDVTSWADAHRVVEEVERELGPIGILVNNAGVSRRAPFLEISESEWDRILSVNLKGTFNTCRAVLPGMVARGAGRVVNISSILGKTGEEGFSHYAASKFGIIGLTQSVAAEMASHDITVNAVCPGIVDTPMWEDLYQDAMAQSDAFSSEEDVRAYVRSRIPLGRTQEPDDIAEMVAFLVSDHARNMTGGSYHVDGGMLPR